MADTTRIPIDFRNPAISHDIGNAFPYVVGLTTPTPDVDLQVWAMAHTGDVDSYLYGVVDVPVSIGATPAAKIILVVFTETATTGNVRVGLATSAVASDAGNLNTALTAETSQTVAIPGTVLTTKEISFTLTSPPSAKNQLTVEFMREASDTTNDTTADNLLVKRGWLEIDLT